MCTHSERPTPLPPPPPSPGPEAASGLIHIRSLSLGPAVTPVTLTLTPARFISQCQHLSSRLCAPPGSRLSRDSPSQRPLLIYYYQYSRPWWTVVPRLLSACPSLSQHPAATPPCKPVCRTQPPLKIGHQLPATSRSVRHSVPGRHLDGLSQLGG